MAGSDKYTVVDSTPKLKREDYQRIKDDSAFYDWKNFIGPSDWEDHLLKKEGAEKYRTHNLPNCASCSGLYELGIALLPTQSGREVGKLKKRSIIPVYIGQADNVRTRLQHYGRGGSHLENSSFSKGELDDCEGNGLFRDVFARGFSIVYRWAPMENKSEAERKEAQLLKTYDYAWNKGSNGARRPNDILQNLYSRTPKSLQLPLIFKKPQFLPQRQVFNGPVSKLAKEVKVQVGDAEESKTFYNGIVCGVDFKDDGTFCTEPPVLGRHRCEEHKGMRIKKQMPKSKVAYIPSIFIDTSDRSWNNTLNKSGSSRTVVKNESSLTCGGDAEKSRTFYNGTVCGVYFEDGAFCTKPAVLGRLRCEDHKGMRVKKQMPKSKVAYIPNVIVDTSHRSFNNTLNKSGSSRTVIKNESSLTCGAITLDGSFCKREPGEGGKRCWQHEGTRINRPTSKPVVTEIPRFTVSDVSVPTCGATTQDGSFCRRKPGEGGKRCWQHKSTRVNGPAPEPIVTEKPSRFASWDVGVSTCGATTQDGSSCRRKPSNGSNRCWQHEGTRVASNSRTSELTYNYTSYGSVSYFSSTCGAITLKGTYCSRAPAAGRQRCWQH